MPQLDPAHPVITTEDTPRLCHVVGVVQPEPGSPKWLSLRVPILDPITRKPNGNLSEPVLVSLNDGQPMDKKGICGGLRFRNAPKTESAFYPLSTPSLTPFSRGAVSLDMAFEDCHYAKFAVEIIREDGVPTEAKIHARP